MIYGHQNDTWHKAGSEELSDSDTYDVTGSYAGIVGMDTLSLTGNEYSVERYNSEMTETAGFEAVDTEGQTMAEANVEAAAKLANYNIANGSFLTLSAHMPNFSIVEENADYDPQTDPSYAKYVFEGYTPNTITGDVMNQLLPGAKYNEVYTAYLDMIADFASQVDGPVMFRPFHEATGSWFWWGAAFCNPETYKSVYKYTVEYLRDVKDVHNFLYLYGPGSDAASVEEYGVRYPGDEYVDLIGFDMYDSDPVDDKEEVWFSNLKNQLRIVQEFADAHGKLMAVTETGIASSTKDPGHNTTVLHETGNKNLNWYNMVLDAVSESDASYFLLWANFSKTDGYYTPYVDSVNEDGSLHGHETLDGFISFYNDSRSVFADDQQGVLQVGTLFLIGREIGVQIRHVPEIVPLPAAGLAGVPQPGQGGEIEGGLAGVIMAVAQQNYPEASPALLQQGPEGDLSELGGGGNVLLQLGEIPVQGKGRIGKLVARSAGQGPEMDRHTDGGNLRELRRTGRGRQGLGLHAISSFFFWRASRRVCRVRA